MMVMDDTYFMKQALLEADKAAERERCLWGAVICLSRAHHSTCAQLNGDAERCHCAC